ncbi:MinD/ParA family protein [Plesiomonas shigelloides]|uniref:MinD/ParA family protein n=1 Tax=Plesiomonas shigelloides TaxID=703 RepID=A0A2P1VP99_PLESH|nr:MinD/ParA family protein [Plesiomonas shigelloides]AVQ86997.1 cobyrinic acid a,c-diamide synthase [Plesiomonas shigelloides]KAB7666551.1 P-loop NTPase [Plesiomonas shigelloides]MBO1106774.1 MinD/ParA family protein [Plesiomonas shigelloides]HAD42844.1 MinD/ParA family protein [Plesiomonas shigelloides]
MSNAVLNDQASGLRSLVQPTKTKVIAVTGGKGGVGKSNITLNMAVAMARKGLRVMIFDADLSLANVDLLLGIRVGRNLSHVLAGLCDLEDIIVEGPYGLKVIPASPGTQSMTDLSEAQHAGLIRAFSSLQDQVDVLLIDTAAGISDMVMSFSRAAQDVLVTVCDEPTSIADAYALMKVLNRQHGLTRFKIVANMVRSYREGLDLFSKLSRVTDRFLDASLELVACIPLDEHVRLAVRKQKVVVDAYPQSPAALALNTLAQRASSWPAPNHPTGHLEFFVERLLRRPVMIREEECRE